MKTTAGEFSMANNMNPLATVGGGSNGASLDDDRVGDKPAPAYESQESADRAPACVGGGKVTTASGNREACAPAPAYTHEMNEGCDFWRKEAWVQQDRADCFQKSLGITLAELDILRKDVEQKEKLIVDFQILHHRISSENTAMRCLLKNLMAHSGVADAGDDMKDESDLITEREVREFLK